MLATTSKAANFARQHSRYEKPRRQSRSSSVRKASWSSLPPWIRRSGHILASPTAKAASPSSLKTAPAASAPLEAIKTLTLKFPTVAVLEILIHTAEARAARPIEASL